MTLAILNAVLLDTERMELVGERQLVIEGDRILAVEESLAAPRAERVIDARGRFVLPGFIDAHVHHGITTMDFPRLARMTPVERALGMARLAEASVARGFTTVRDVGGEVSGLVRAIESGLCGGPRIVRSGRVLSQTGGHGDILPVATTVLCACQVQTSDFGHVADGPDAVRLAVRHELRGGSDFIKIMTSGGVASPTDPFDCVQYTAEEVRAATLETDHRHTYTTSHAYQPEAIRIAIDNGVRCIEHGNLIDAETAAHMVTRDVTLVPTLVTYKAMAEMGAKVGLPERNLAKNRGVFDAGLRSIELARQAGVTLGFGTDLLGEAQTWQARELAIRADLEPAADVLHAMYRVNARLCRLEDQVGVLVPGACADLVLTRVDPLRDLAALAEPERTLDAVIARGRIVVDRLD
ncbi:MAG: amidohydrolase family protein [Myxococcota bacterium]